MARGEYTDIVGRGGHGGGGHGGGGHGGGHHGGGHHGGHGWGRGWGWGGWGWPYYGYGWGGYGWPYYGYGYSHPYYDLMWPDGGVEVFPHWRSPRHFMHRHRRRIHTLLGAE